jgi:hypothetical protein
VGGERGQRAASVARTAKHPNAVGGCPQGTFSAIGPRENFSSLQKGRFMREGELYYFTRVFYRRLADSLLYPLFHTNSPLLYRYGRS